MTTLAGFLRFLAHDPDLRADARRAAWVRAKIKRTLCAPLRFGWIVCPCHRCKARRDWEIAQGEAAKQKELISSPVCHDVAAEARAFAQKKGTERYDKLMERRPVSKDRQRRKANKDEIELRRRQEILSGSVTYETGHARSNWKPVEDLKDGKFLPPLPETGVIHVKIPPEWLVRHTRFELRDAIAERLEREGIDCRREVKNWEDFEGTMHYTQVEW